ncbi:MAG: alpha/beta hydrolase [Firmicutes bacterium]|nr:alpha/beta hydrolase [Bacillota bacterium]
MLRTKTGLKYFMMGDGPEAVICHPSLGLGRFLFYRLIPPLSRKWTVVAYDPRGVGENADFTPRLDDWVADVGDLMEELGKPTHLIGVSLGTWVMSRVAARWPERVRRVVLIGATVGFGQGAAAVEARRAELAQQGMEAFARSYARSTLTAWADPEIVEQLAQELATCRPEQYVRAMAEIYLTDNTAAFQGMKAETLLIVGTEDQRTPPAMADAASALIPHSFVRVIPNAGHLALMDQPVRIQELVEEFLSTGHIED